MIKKVKLTLNITQLRLKTWQKLEIYYRSTIKTNKRCIVGNWNIYFSFAMTVLTKPMSSTICYKKYKKMLKYWCRIIWQEPQIQDEMAFLFLHTELSIISATSLDFNYVKPFLNLVQLLLQLLTLWQGVLMI